MLAKGAEFHMCTQLGLEHGWLNTANVLIYQSSQINGGLAVTQLK